MNYLNYFQPYTSDSQKENSLTRAFMSLLRLCPLIRHGFYEMIREKALEKIPVDAETTIPPLHKLSSLDVSIDIQKQSLPQNSQYLSVLLSNDTIPLQETIKPEERTAQYDGIFSIDNITFFIENKPYNNIGEWQLCPSNKDLVTSEGQDFFLYDFAVNVTWREIITHLNHIVEALTLDEAQKILIDDFLTYVDAIFPDLNPFDKFHLCKSQQLVQRRIESLFKAIKSEENEVLWHKGWAYYLPTPGYQYIERIGAPLEYDPEKEDWHFYLTLILADTTRQARALYGNTSLNLECMLKLREKEGWEVRPDFHIGHMQRHLIYFETEPENLEKYIQYWRNNDCGQISADLGEPNVFTALDIYLKKLDQEGVIIYDEVKKAQVVEQFSGNSQRKSVNIRPGLYVGKYYPKQVAERLDKENKLEGAIIRDINYFFEMLDEVRPGFIKQL